MNNTQDKVDISMHSKITKECIDDGAKIASIVGAIIAIIALIYNIYHDYDSNSTNKNESHQEKMATSPVNQFDKNSIHGANEPSVNSEFYQNIVIGLQTNQVDKKNPDNANESSAENNFNKDIITINPINQIDKNSIVKIKKLEENVSNAEKNCCNEKFEIKCKHPFKDSSNGAPCFCDGLGEGIVCHK